jgi:hypothetical protein
MIKFEWKLWGENNKYIDWTATWDGKHDEPWYESYEGMGHPFQRTVDFEQNEQMFKAYGTDEYNPELMKEAGDIVANNPVTLAYCEMLSNPSRIPEYSGNSEPFGYYVRLIGNLSLLWD